MNKLHYALLYILISTSLIGQVRIPIESSDELMPNSIFSQVPEKIKHSKPYLRQRWFLEQRAFPDDFIPDNAYENAIKQKEDLRLTQNPKSIPSVNWVSLGPTPGYYFSYGNISGRVISGAFHPTNPNIIYIGPANGGVWKSVDAGASWSPLSDFEASLSMGAIAIDPNNPDIIYAGTGEATYSGSSYYGRGLLKSTNGGTNWTSIKSPFPATTYFSRLKIRPNHSSQLLAALGNSGLYRSSDYGINWSQIKSGRVDDVVFSPSGDTAFAVGSGIGIMRSIDGGITFSSYGAVGFTSGARTHFDIALSNPAIMWATVYDNSTVIVLKSTNYGVNWNQISMSQEFINESGQAWYDLYCVINPHNHNQVYIGCVDIYRTLDGNSFTNITQGYSGGGVHVDQHYMFFHPFNANTLISCNDGGIWKSTDSGNNFTNLNQNLTLTQFYRIAASPFNPKRIMGGTQDNGTQKTDSTLEWAAAYSGDGGEVCFNPFNSNFILGETQYNGVFRTTNGGINWISAQTGLVSSESKAWVAPIIHHPNISGTFYTARNRVYKSTNNGGNWTAISGSVYGSSAIRELAQSKSNPNTMFASSGSYLFKSTDGGVNWASVSTGLPNKTITSISIHPNDERIVFVTFSGFGTNKVFKTISGGNEWTSIHGNLPDSPVNDLLIYSHTAGVNNTYFVATDVGVFLTDDDGINWYEVSNGLPNTVVMHLDFSPGTQMLRAGTHGRGVYEAYIDFSVPVELLSFSLSQAKNNVSLQWSTATETNNLGFEIERKLKNQDWTLLSFIKGNGTTTSTNSYCYTDSYEFLPYSGKALYRLKQIDFDGKYEYSEPIAAEIEFIPSETKLSQNFPNPFNPTTTIQYSIKGDCKVRVSIFNTLGQEIELLLSENQSAGAHEVVWNAQNYPSGIYFYKFETSDVSNSVYKEVKKLLLLK